MSTPHDLAFEQWMCELYHIDQPLTWYHLPWLLDAEAGRLRYDRTTYPMQGVSNNAMALHGCGLLADGDGGMVLTEKGRQRLARARAEQPDYISRYEDDDQEDGDEPAAVAEAPAAIPRPAPTPPAEQQLGLFEGVTPR